MSDLELRTVERAAAIGDAYARERLVRKRVRAGVDLGEAQREAYGFAQGDVYTWTHPRTRTVHLFKAGRQHTSACGRSPQPEHRYQRMGPNAFWSKLVAVIIKGWKPYEKISCKQCQKTGNWLLHTVHPRPGERRWGFTIPDWSVFE